jgi:hypothetical protein
MQSIPEVQSIHELQLMNALMPPENQRTSVVGMETQLRPRRFAEYNATSA